MTTQQGYLLISDITGYTSFLNQSELEHARDSLSSLLKLLIEYTRSPLVISRLEGDAVISYAPKGSFLQGQTLIEMVETTYLAFRKALDLMMLNTICTCNACRNIPNLDLKFFVHYGTFSMQDLGAYRELIGNDVNIVHRLGKNMITQALGLKAYAAYTEAVINELDLADIAASMQAHSEHYDDVGEIQIYVQNMHAVWQQRKNEVRVVVKPEEAMEILEYEFPLPPPLFWEYITKPEYRSILQASDSQELQAQVNGRKGPDTVYMCYHGQQISIATILDWEPFKQYTTNKTVPGIQALSMNFTYMLEPAEGGTKFTYIWGHAKGPWVLRMLFSIFGKPAFIRINAKNIQLLRERIQKDLKEGVIILAKPEAIPQEKFTEAIAESLEQAKSAS